DLVAVFVGKRVGVAEVVVAGNGLPRRHDLRLQRGLDVVGVGDHVIVGGQLERSDVVRAMALLAFRLDDARDITRIRRLRGGDGAHYHEKTRETHRSLFYSRNRVTMACASAERPSPTGPTPSAVLNFTETRPISRPSVEASCWRIAGR